MVGNRDNGQCSFLKDLTFSFIAGLEILCRFNLAKGNFENF